MNAAEQPRIAVNNINSCTQASKQRACDRLLGEEGGGVVGDNEWLNGLGDDGDDDDGGVGGRATRCTRCLPDGGSEAAGSRQQAADSHRRRHRQRQAAATPAARQIRRCTTRRPPASARPSHSGRQRAPASSERGHGTRALGHSGAQGPRARGLQRAAPAVSTPKLTLPPSYKHAGVLRVQYAQCSAGWREGAQALGGPQDAAGDLS
ncbi:hypothetical protein BDZ91DRAFT_828402 [Kalaharituber pfeilii]|nr:hypothetical protein BDZ91DRAFT_828402 [Kalaharituber pfeilii]